MSAIVLVDTFQMSSQFIDTAINKLLRQRIPLINDCLFQLFHSFKQSSQYKHCCRTPYTAYSTSFKSGLYLLATWQARW